MALGEGSLLAGYRIEAPIGRGGMGSVWRARDIRLDRVVALKILSPALADDRKFRDRFLSESRLAASLDHPNIVPVFEAGEADGELFIAMRFVNGADLATLIEREGPLEIGRTMSILRGIADALDAAHERGLIHRDVKPGNILVAHGSQGEHAYLSDFGLTKEQGSAASLTNAGQVVGSVDYVAAEVIEGRPIDARVDVYSLACVLYECLTGAPPFRRDSDVATLWAHVQADRPRLSAVRPDLVQLDPVLETAMSTDPDGRYASTGAFVRAAGAALATAGTRAFLFSDLRGYTAYVERAGDAAAVALLGRYRTIVRGVIANQDGAEIRTEGDSFYVIFPTASLAVRAGLEIVAAAARASSGATAPIQVGVGIHAGETAETTEGPVGSAVNVAARICSQAHAGEVLVSGTVRGLTRTSLLLTFNPRGTPRLKGVDERIDLFAVSLGSTTGQARRAGARRRPPRSAWAAVGGAAAVGMVGVLAIALGLPSRFGGTAASPSPAATTGGPSAPSGSGSAATGLSGPTAGLLAQIPPGIQPTCGTTSTAGGGLGGVASLRCELTATGADTVWYDRFEARGEMVDQFERVVSASGVGAGECGPTVDSAVGDWRFGSTYGGRMVCYQDRGRSWLLWTYESDRIVAQATRSDGDFAALYEWWKTVGPYLR